VKAEVDLLQCVFRCERCGFVADRDWNEIAERRVCFSSSQQPSGWIVGLLCTANYCRNECLNEVLPLPDRLDVHSGVSLFASVTKSSSARYPASNTLSRDDRNQW